MPWDLGSADDDGIEVPGYRNYLSFCDDSGLHGSTHYGFGSFWIPNERRGDLHKAVRELGLKHRHTHEIKWNHISKKTLPFYLELVRLFFASQWMMFHCLVVRKGYVDKDLHGGDYDLARRKHFAMLLQKKIEFFGAGGAKAYHVRVDCLPSAYAKADQAAEIIINNALARDIGRNALKSLFTRDSKFTLGIQLADLFLGAVMDGIHQDSTSNHKAIVRTEIARYLGWSDLHHDTRPEVWKFNVWSFWDPKGTLPREMRTRDVRTFAPYRR